MNSVQFKLKASDGLTRLALFPSKPTWLALADKIQSLFNIPLDKVALSYHDSDDDEITLSTQEELEGFYQASFQPGQIIKFNVFDLSSARSVTDKSLPSTPRGGSSTNPRNTFGGNLSDGLPFNIDEDWQHFPPHHLGGMFMGGRPRDPDESSLHAFVEVLDSDVKSSSSSSSSSITTQPTPRFDKGKAKALDDDVSSVASVIAEEEPERKPDIHVLGRQASSGLFETAVPSRRSSRRSSIVAVPIGNESTPKRSVKELRRSSIAPSTRSNPASSIPIAPSVSEESGDPPLPELDANSLERERANPSLPNDIANLLSTLSNIISTHPELSEGLKNILHNAASGNYWAVQRDAIGVMAQSAAESISRADQEAGRRVAEALGSLFRAISQVVDTVPLAGTTSTEAPAPSAAAPNNTARGPDVTAETVGADASFSAPWSRPWFGRGWGAGPYPYPPYQIFGRRSSDFSSYRGSFLQNRPPFGPHGPPPPPPPPPPGFHPPPPPPPGFHPPPPPPPPGPPPPHVPRVPPPPFSGPPRAPIPGADSFVSYRREKKNSQDLRAQVEAAKLLYKAEKERYRQDREERKRERNRKMIEMLQDMSIEEHNDYPVGTGPGPNASNVNSNMPPPPPPPVPKVPEKPTLTNPAAIISKGGNHFPSFELAKVPQRTNSQREGPSRSGSRRTSENMDPTSRAVKRILKKLGDMGFTERAHPDLASRVRALLPEGAAPTPDKEEDIATTMVNELVSRTKSPVASGSGAKGDAIPGGWN